MISSDSAGITQLSARSTLSLPLHDQLGVQVGGGYTFVTSPEHALDHAFVGAGLSFSPTSWLRLSGAAAAYFRQTPELSLSAARGTLQGSAAGGTTNLEPLSPQATDWTVSAAGYLAAAVGPFRGFAIELMGDHRPFVDLARLLSTDEELFYNAGVNGAHALADAYAFDVDELQLHSSYSASSWLWIYSNARGFRITDRNWGFSVSSGLGLSLIRPFISSTPIDVVLCGSSYVLGYQQQASSYFSPDFLHSYSGGGEIHARVSRWLSITARGGLSAAFTPERVDGWYGGGALSLGRGRFVARINAETRMDVYYTWNRAWLELRIGI